MRDTPQPPAGENPLAIHPSSSSQIVLLKRVKEQQEKINLLVAQQRSIDDFCKHLITNGR